MSFSNNITSVNPTIKLDFCGSEVLDPLVSFSRNSVGTRFNRNGVLEVISANRPRFDYDTLTREPRGLLLEEARTNSIRNNTMVGAAVGIPGTLPTNWSVSDLGTLVQEVVGVGTSNGINYIDLRFSGTTSTTQLNVRQEGSGTGGVAASNGQTWVYSVWTSVVGGSLTNISATANFTNIYDSSGAYIGGFQYTGLNTSSTLTRTSLVATISLAGTAYIQPQIVLAFTSGVAIDITLRIGMPQLELGGFVTSVIPTSSAAVPRVADFANMSSLAFSSAFKQGEGTTYVEFRNDYMNQSHAGSAFAFTDNSYSYRKDTIFINPRRDGAFYINGRLILMYDSGSVNGGSAVDAVGASNLNNSTTAIYKYVAGWDATSMSITGTNYTVGNANIPATNLYRIPNCSRLAFPIDTYSYSQFSGHVRKFAHYPKKLSNAEMESLKS